VVRVRVRVTIGREGEKMGSPLFFLTPSDAPYRLVVVMMMAMIFAFFPKHFGAKG